MNNRQLSTNYYIWQTKDDSAVRSAHAARADRIFRWDDPPEGGHPGEDYNCRCRAEPVPLDEPLPYDFFTGGNSLRYADLFKYKLLGIYNGLVQRINEFKTARHDLLDAAQKPKSEEAKYVEARKKHMEAFDAAHNYANKFVSAAEAATPDKKFTPMIEKTSKITGVSDKTLKAIIGAESNFDIEARPFNKETGKLESSAAGLGQVTDGAMQDVNKNFGTNFKVNDKFDAEKNVLMSAYYYKLIYNDAIQNGVPSQEAEKVAIAGYNAGRTAISTATQRSKNRADWREIVKMLPKSGHYTVESVTAYVEGILKRAGF